MRAYLFTGGLLTLAAVLLVGLGATLGLDLEGVALVGLAAGGILALVPDRSPLQRCCGFAAGFVLTWLGYVARAALLPDTSSGRAVALAGILVAGTLVVAVFRLPLWSMLLGAGTLAGSYEAAFTLSPPEVVDTSLAAVTAVLVALGAGFLGAAMAPASAAAAGRAADERPDADRIPEPRQDHHFRPRRHAEVTR